MSLESSDWTGVGRGALSLAGVVSLSDSRSCSEGYRLQASSTRFLAFAAASRWGLVLIVAAGAEAREVEEESRWESDVVNRGSEFCGGRCRCRVGLDSTGILLGIAFDGQR